MQCNINPHKVEGAKTIITLKIRVSVAKIIENALLKYHFFTAKQLHTYDMENIFSTQVKL